MLKNFKPFFVSLIFSFLLCGNVAFAQHPNIEISHRILNFDEVLINSSKSLTITLTNTGTVDLEISEVSISGDGFTLFRVGNSITISAGNSTNIAVQFSPIEVKAYTGAITLNHNAGNSPITVSLTGRGVVPRPNIEISHRILNFDEVLINSSKSLTITLTNTGTVDLEMSEVSISGDGFALFRVGNPIIISAGNSTNITVQFSPIEVKAYTGAITLTHNAGNSPITIPLTGTGAKPATHSITISPNPLAFGDVTINSSSSRTITITNNGTVDLVISEVSINGDGFTLSGVIIISWALIDNVANIIQVTLPEVTTPITIVAGTSLTIAVQFSPIEVKAYTGTITLTHNAGNSPITISLTGTGIEPRPNIEISHRILNFDEVLINSSKSLTITITNTGTVDLEISEVSISGDGFTLFRVGNPITISAGNSTNIAVQFSPIEVKAYTGTITLTHNAGNSPITIPLTGTGAEPATHSITVSPNPLAFGDVKLSSYRDLPIVIKNESNVGLIITNFEINVGNVSSFSIVDAIDIAVAPTVSYTATVRFSPDGTGAKVATLKIVTNIGEETVNLSGSGTPTISVDKLSEIPNTYNLMQNYPNPFNPTTIIEYTIPKDEFVKLTVYDINGKIIKELVNDYKSVGKYSVGFNASGYSSGTYYYKLEAGEYKNMKKMVLLK